MLLVANLTLAGELLAQQKFPVPDAQTQRPVKKAAADLYAKRFRDAATDAEKATLAKEMVQTALKAPDGSVDQYVLLSIASDVAVAAGDAQAALAAAEHLAERFDVPGRKLQSEKVLAAAQHATSVSQCKALAEAASSLIGRLLAADDYVTAMELCEAARSVARNEREHGLVRDLTARLEEIKELEAAFKEYRDAVATLEKDPSEAKANQAAGRYLCFHRGDWGRGLPMLARGSDERLKAVAAKDLKGASTPDEQAVLANAWWTLAETNEGHEKVCLMLRAGTWYQKAVPGLSGLVKIQAEKRLAEIAKLGRDVAVAAAEPPYAIAPFDEAKARALQLEWAKHLGLPVEQEVDLPGGVKLTMVLIPPGEFVMGSPEAEQQLAIRGAKANKDDNAPARIRTEVPHRVRISRPFYLGKHEVTQAQWQAVMGNNPSEFKDPAKPVEHVSWENVQPFLAKLNAAGARLLRTEGRASGGSNMKFDLPTEAQWEYACRAGTTTAFSFGDSEAMIGGYGWHKFNAGQKTHPVGEKKPNPWGLHDMHGNVWEWCADWYDAEYYAHSPRTDPTGPKATTSRVERGGSWGAPAWSCRSAIRHAGTPGRWNYVAGFRLAVVSADTSGK